MKRELWIGTLSKYGCPPWPCPHCKKGTVQLDRTSLAFHETVLSKQGRQHDEFAHDWIDYRFTAWADCASCKGRVAIAGIGGPEQVPVSEDDWDWQDRFAPQIWTPMPEMIDIPEKCPKEVRNALNDAFALHAFQRAACASRLRVALEALMDHEGIPRKRKNAKGKFDQMTLHARLMKFAMSSTEAGEHLMALKWLGNAGSHEGEVTLDDLLNAFEIFEHALAEIIGKRKQRVAKLAKGLTKKFAK